jgi:hypothetical protein
MKVPRLSLGCKWNQNNEYYTVVSSSSSRIIKCIDDNRSFYVQGLLKDT